MNNPLQSWLTHPSDNTVITLADWYHTAAKLGPRFPLVSSITRTLDPLLTHNVTSLGSDATLINGHGRSTSTTDAQLSVINVIKGKR